MTFIMITSKMQYLMQGELNKTNSSHTIRKNLAETYTNENYANGKHKLNKEHCEQYQKHRRIFFINTSKKFTEPQKLGTQDSKYECRTLYSSIDVTFITSWDLDTNLEKQPNSLIEIKNQSHTHKIITNSDQAYFP